MTCLTSLIHCRHLRNNLQDTIHTDTNHARMNERTKELILSATRVLASVPEGVSVEEVDGVYTIDAAPRDLGAIMGKQRKHASAIEYLAQCIEPAAVVRVASRNGVSQPAPKAEWKHSTNAQWSMEDESRLKGRIEHLLHFLFPSAALRFSPAVKESTYIVLAGYVPMDVVGALHTLFRAWGMRNGRFVTITCPDDERKAV